TPRHHAAPPAGAAAPTGTGTHAAGVGHEGILLRLRTGRDGGTRHSAARHAGDPMSCAARPEDVHGWLPAAAYRRSTSRFARSSVGPSVARARDRTTARLMGPNSPPIASTRDRLA